MVAASTRQNLIIAGSALIGLTTIGAVAYLLIQDERQTKHLRSVRTLQKSLSQSLSKIEADLQTLLDQDIRLAQVRTRTLRQHPIYPGDPHVRLPSLGLIDNQDNEGFGENFQETEEELIRERSNDLGFVGNPVKVRQGYKKLDFLVQSINERLLRLLESLDAVSPRELTDLGDGFGGIPRANGPEIQAFEKVRKRKRSDIAKIQKLMGQMDLLAASFKDRVKAVEAYEDKIAEAEAEAKEKARKEAEEKIRQEELEKVRNDQGDDNSNNKKTTNGHVPSAVSALVQENVSFAQIAAHNIPAPQVVAPTKDLEKMKEGITFANVVAEPAPVENNTKEEVEETVEVKDEPVLVQSEDLEKKEEAGSHLIDVIQQEQEEIKTAAAAVEEVITAEVAAAL
ncbi:hypothetical protein FBU30_000257 [Linnemannia zychae]|nr:hypothetical protein FBU30_000257 [Linnemannia zychae]